jgi:Ca2+-binding RTX toxin-like protein
MHGIENINGSRFADVITGNLGDNFIFGGDGDDHVFYTGGFDAIDGGNDVDTIDFSQFGAAVDVTLQLLLSAPEAFTTNTSSVFTGTAVPIADLKNFENIVGTAFADSLIGNNFNNNIDGGAGNDFLSYNGGFDVLNGNTGIDTAKFDQMTSAVFVDLAGGGFEAKGNGTANANAGGLSNLADLQSIENLLGTSYNDVLRGDGNANLIDGGAGSDILGGRAGNNTLEGGPGNDSYEFTGSAHDTYFDDSGTDRILIGSISDFIGSGRQGNDLVLTFTNGTIDIEDQFNGHPIETLVDIHGVTLVLATSMTGGDGSGIISGTDGNDVMDGRGGDDYLFGGTGNDHLDGGAGRDLLEGGAGDDILTGGRGRDIFVFTPASQTSPGSGNDVITDFQAGKDQIDLTAFHASFRALDDNHDGQLESGEGDGHISVHVHNGDTTLTFNGGSVRIEGVTHLTAHDLLL